MSEQSAAVKVGGKVPSDLPEDPSISYNPVRARISRTLPIDEFRKARTSVTEMSIDLDVEPELPRVLEAECLPSGNFAFHQIIGEGGYGEVWKARQLSLGRFVAIKRLRDDIRQRNASSPQALQLLERTFQSEALAMGLLDHPNIIPIYDLTRDTEGRSQLAMKLVRGEQWNRLLSQDREMPQQLFLSRHLPILIQLSQAVAFAHARGIVHRDLKPSQVMVGEFGEVLLMDWGLAMVFDMTLAHGCEADPAVLERLPTQANAQSPCGTVAFMAPEQTEKTAANTGPWTDIYLLGGILYYILTGHPPHSAPDSQAAFLQAMSGEICTVESDSPDGPPQDLMKLAMKAMARDPKRRVSGAKEFLSALQDHLSGAGRLREAAELTARAKEYIEKGSGDYKDFTECITLLNRAWVLWPESPELPKLNEKVLVDYTNAALKNGDLVLARVQAERLPPGDVRTALLKKAEIEHHRTSSQAMQKRILLFSTAILFIAALFAFYRNYDKTKTSELFDRVNKLRRAENALAEEIVRAIWLPQTLAVGSSRVDLQACKLEYSIVSPK